MVGNIGLNKKNKKNRNKVNVKETVDVKVAIVYTVTGDDAIQVWKNYIITKWGRYAGW